MWSRRRSWSRACSPFRHAREARPSVRGGIRGWFRNLCSPMLQPRMVMGLALTILFFGMMARCAGIPERS